MVWATQRSFSSTEKAILLPSSRQRAPVEDFHGVTVVSSQASWTSKATRLHSCMEVPSNNLPLGQIRKAIQHSTSMILSGVGRQRYFLIQVERYALTPRAA